MTLRTLCATSLIVLASACSQQQQSATFPISAGNDAATRGYAAYRSNDIVGAEREFGAALAADPANSYALLGLGAVNEVRGDLGSAVRYYSQAEVEGRGDITTVNYVGADGKQRERSAGVSELAARNLGRVYQASGYRSAHRGSTTTVGTSYLSPAPVAASVEGVYFADPQATQPLTETLYVSPSATTPLPAHGGSTHVTQLAPMAVEHYDAGGYTVDVQTIGGGTVAGDYVTVDSVGFADPMEYAAPQPLVQSAAYSETASYDPAMYEPIGVYGASAGTAMSYEMPAQDSRAVYEPLPPAQAFPVESAGSYAVEPTMPYSVEPASMSDGGQYQVIGENSASFAGGSYDYGTATPIMSTGEIGAAMYGVTGSGSASGGAMGTELIYLDQ